MNYVQIIAAFFVWRFVLKQVMAMIGGLLLLIVLACVGMWWPLVAATLLFLIFWGLASLLWRAVFGRPVPAQPTLEALCAESRRISEHAQGFSFDNALPKLRADARARLAPR